MDCHIADACFPLRCCVCVFSIPLYFVCVLFFLWISAVPLGVDLRLRLQVCHSARSRNSEFELRSRREIKIDDRDVGLCLVSDFSIPLSRGSNLTPSAPESR
jgi:hypothetical protein